MPRRPEIGNIQLYPNRPLKKSDKNGYVLKFYCPIQQKRIRKNCGTRDKREARRILRECQQRLLSGEYVASGGAISAEHAPHSIPTLVIPDSAASDGKSWQECYDRYIQHHKKRVRKSTHRDAVYRLQIAERIFEQYRRDRGLPEGFTVNEVMTLDMLDFLQDQLLDGAECRYERRSPHTVNSVIAVVMTFARFCFDRDWIDKVPRVQKLETDEVMKGRPISQAEFELMLAAVPKVVGETATESWRFALKVLWESGFRIGDLMDFSWDGLNHIHPVWPTRTGQYPTIVIPSTQKNRRNQEVPMLPGLQKLLSSVPRKLRTGWVVSPSPKDYQIHGHPDWYQPSEETLQELVSQYSNCAIAEACCVTETAVRKWLKNLSIARKTHSSRSGKRMSKSAVTALRKQAKRHQSVLAQRTTERLTCDHVGKVISEIGKTANVVVQKKSYHHRLKYASAHDLRRGCAERLINAGVSAETLKVIFRHSSFATTERHYGASRSAQSAANEVADKLNSTELVGGLMGGITEAPQLTAEQLFTLKRLLQTL